MKRTTDRPFLTLSHAPGEVKEMALDYDVFSARQALTGHHVPLVLHESQRPHAACLHGTNLGQRMGWFVVRKCRLRRNFAPEGHMIIAQHFSAGMRSTEDGSPGGTVECTHASGRSASAVPPGLMGFLVLANPAINRWAIVGCPYGTRGLTTYSYTTRYATNGHQG